MKNTLKLVLAIILFGCLTDFPYSYYQFIRFAAMVGFAYLAYSANKQGNTNEAFIYIALAILFQPFIKIALGRNLWNIVDLIVGVGLLLSLARPKKIKRQITNNSNENIMVNTSVKQTEIKSKTTTKNNWLHPSDELGKLEKGVEFESKTYLREKKDTNSQDFTIL